MDKPSLTTLETPSDWEWEQKVHKVLNSTSMVPRRGTTFARKLLVFNQLVTELDIVIRLDFPLLSRLVAPFVPSKYKLLKKQSFLFSLLKLLGYRQFFVAKMPESFELLLEMEFPDLPLDEYLIISSHKHLAIVIKNENQTMYTFSIGETYEY